MTSIIKVNNIQNSSGTAYNFIKQVKSGAYTDAMSLTVDQRTDIPNLSLSITPSSVSSKILIMASVCYGGTHTNNYGNGYIMRDSTDIAVGTTATGNRQNISFPLNLVGAGNEHYKLHQSSVTFLDSPNSTSAITYKVQVRHDVDGTMYINRTGQDSDADYGHRGISTLTIMEVAG